MQLIVFIEFKGHLRSTEFKIWKPIKEDMLKNGMLELHSVSIGNLIDKLCHCYIGPKVT